MMQSSSLIFQNSQIMAIQSQENTEREREKNKAVTLPVVPSVL